MTPTNKTNTIELSTLEQELLTTLWNNPELYGLQIMNAINEARENKADADQFRKSLPDSPETSEEKVSLLSMGDETDEETGGARRKYYTLTEMGKLALQQTWDYHEYLVNWQPI